MSKFKREVEWRISELELKIKDLEKNFKIVDPLEVEKLKTHLLSLRGLVNKKLGKLSEEDPFSEEGSKEKDYKEVIIKE